MQNNLFIQGGGDDGYKADATLVQNLQNELGKDYHIRYPQLTINETEPDFGWLRQIGTEIDKSGDGVIFIAHSLGASLLLRYLSENTVSKYIAGVFLLAPPFWSGDEDWKEGLKLRPDFTDRLPKNIPLFFYHAHDDKEVPPAHFDSYKRLLPNATFNEFESGGHQFTGHVSDIALAIKTI